MSATTSLHIPPLMRFVEEVRLIVPPPGRAFDVERLPDGRTSLVFRVLEGGGKADMWVAGPHTRAIFKSKTGIERTVIVRFKPGQSVPLIGVAASELTDQVVLLEDLWGGVALDFCAELLDVRDEVEVLDCVCRGLAFRAEKVFQTSSGELARRAVCLLEAGEVLIGNVAEQLGVTGRHLRRAFTENVGIGPKEFARTVRLRRAMTMAATSRDWAGIAADAGYCDQAHLIGDFHQLVGLTPAVFFNRARPDYAT